MTKARDWKPVVGLALLVASAAAAQDRSHAVRAAIDDGCARNVILMIGDGMGDSEITAARNYQVGAAGRLHLDTLPLTGAYTTYSLSEENPALPNYVTDSAASATGWATGHKTSNDRISTSAATDLPLPTLIEMARRRGVRTGNVTTAELTDASPAALMAHVNHRSCEGPADMARCPQYEKGGGGAGSIAEQAIEQGIDVLLGGGRVRFAQTIVGGPNAGSTVLDVARQRGYHVVETASELEAARPPVLGLFAPQDLVSEWSGERAAAYPGTGPQRCQEGQAPATQPTLADMTRKALEMLADLAKDGPGFLLQVEGACIDKNDHAFQPCGQIGETIGFDEAVRVALDFARADGETLVVVTADHAHSCQIVSSSMLGAENHPAGMWSTLITHDGAPMTLSYATNGHGRWQGHSGTQVRLAAYGPQAANVVGVTEQTQLFHTIARALGLDGAPRCGFWSQVGRWFGRWGE